MGVEAGPATVAWGFYWSEAEPVLTIRSGDIIDVDTMLTSSPTRLEGMGLPPEQVQQSLRGGLRSSGELAQGPHADRCSRRLDATAR